MSDRAAAHPEAIEIGLATDDDHRHVVDILNDAAATSIASFATRPTSVAEQRDWFKQFSSTGPHRLLIARRGNEVLGYTSSQPYRPHDAFQQTVEVGIALHA